MPLDIDGPEEPAQAERATLITVSEESRSHLQRLDGGSASLNEPLGISSTSSSVGVTTSGGISASQIPTSVRSGFTSRESAMSSHLASMSEELHNLSQMTAGSTRTGPISFESTLRERLHMPDPPTSEE